jgi:glycosyltransferase involved in cell wall biosynthesis
MSKKKILLLSDDLRMSSGVATMSAEIVRNTIHKFDWVQVGGAIDHPEKNKEIDLGDAVLKDWKLSLGEDGIKPYLKLYPTSGYGNQQLIRNLIDKESPDAIMIYTDPRFWVWLFQMEHELRMHIPMFYYNIWDDLPYPMWNQPYYDSVDALFNISKQTVNIVKNVRSSYEPWQVTYIPHGINEEVFYPIDKTHVEYPKVENFKKKFSKDVDFIVFYNNRNIRRKLPGDVILAFKEFCDMLPKELANKCALLMHTQPVDKNGTDLPAVKNAVAPDCNIYFSDKRLDQKEMNLLYNMCDITLNMASNEGFGLGTAESLMCGKPIIVNITGGMQDQCGFKYKGKHLTADDYDWVHTLHDRNKWMNNPDLTYGDWVKPIWPNNRSLQGSPPTPYIFDDRCGFEEAAVQIYNWYKTPKEDRDKIGLKGREWMLTEEIGMSAKHMGDRFINDIETVFENWKPRERFEIFKA